MSCKWVDKVLILAIVITKGPKYRTDRSVDDCMEYLKSCYTFKQEVPTSRKWSSSQG